MELQTLQEALKVEIQVHQKLVAQMKQDPQNAELKKQLHELQAKITALSEKQKKVVEQLRKDLLLKPEQPELKAWVEPALPDGKDSALGSKQGLLPQPALSTQQTVTVTSVLSTKAVPLVLKAANPTMPVSIVAQRPTVNMVTTIGNMAQSNVINTDSQNAPINLQTSAKVTNQGLSKNAVMVQATSTAQPIRVPQFTPPPRLMPRPSCLPQVRPRSITPNVPIAPAPPAMMPPPQLLQRPLMLTAKMTGASLPSTSSPIHQVRIVNGQPCATLAKTLPSCQLTGIVITTPADPSHLTSPQTLQIASLVMDTKTVKNQGGTNQKAVNTSSSPTPPSVPKPNHEHDPQKRAFMVSLGLVTHHHLEEIQSRRQERKRRTTANPVYSGATFEPERKKSVVTYLNTPVSQTTRKRGRPPKYSSIVEPSPPPTTPPSSSHMAPSGSDQLQTRSSLCNTHPHPLPLHSPSSGEGDIHEDFCTVCRRSGQLLMCDTCSRVYHLDCLDPPLITIPKGMWICPKCQDQILKKEEAVPWPGTLAIVHSYIAYKAAKEEEKQKLLKWSAELKEEREQLEQRVKQLSSSITKCMETKNTILARQKEMQASLEKVKSLVHLIRSLDPPSTVGIVNGGMDCSSSCANVMDHSDSATVPSIETNAIKTVSDGTPKPSVETTAIKTVSDGLTEPCVETTTIGTMSDGTTEPCVKPAAIKTVSNGMTEPCTETTAIKTVSDGTTEPCTETTAIKSVTDGKTEPCTETTAIKTMSDGTTEPSTETTAIKTVSDGTTEPCTETTAIKTISDGTMDPCIETTAIKTTNKTVGDTKSGLSVETTAVKPASDGTEEVSTCEERDPHSSDSSRNSSSTTEPLQLSVPAPTNSMDRQK